MVLAEVRRQGGWKTSRKRSSARTMSLRGTSRQRDHPAAGFNFSILGHVGCSTGDYWDNAFGDDQIDWSLGVGYTVGKFSLGVKWVDTDGDVKVTSDAFNNEGRVIATIATTFPWAE